MSRPRSRGKIGGGDAGHTCAGGGNGEGGGNGGGNGEGGGDGSDMIDDRSRALQRDVFSRALREETVQPKRFCEEIQKKKREKERTRTDERR